MVFDAVFLLRAGLGGRGGASGIGHGRETLLSLRHNLWGTVRRSVGNDRLMDEVGSEDGLAAKKGVEGL